MSVLDRYELQGSLFESASIGVGPLDECERIVLDPCCWLDVATSWLRGGDELMADLIERLAWSAQRRPMYDRMVDVPRLTSSLALDDPSFPPLVREAVTALSSHYRVAFDSVGFNLYRDGRDSVAWHGDRIRHRRRTTVVALVSLGAPRPFRLRPVGGGPSRRFDPGHGDLLVMGGSCQRHWEHCVPKVARAEPRLSMAIRCNSELPPPSGD